MLGLVSQVQRRSFPGHVGSNLVGTAVAGINSRMQDPRSQARIRRTPSTSFAVHPTRNLLWLTAIDEVGGVMDERTTVSHRGTSLDGWSIAAALGLMAAAFLIERL